MTNTPISMINLVCHLFLDMISEMESFVNKNNDEKKYKLAYRKNIL